MDITYWFNFNKRKYMIAISWGYFYFGNDWGEAIHIYLFRGTKFYIGKWKDNYNNFITISIGFIFIEIKKKFKHLKYEDIFTDINTNTQN